MQISQKEPINDEGHLISPQFNVLIRVLKVGNYKNGISFVFGIMRILRNIVFLFVMLFACQTYAQSPNRIDSLRNILDQKKVADSSYIKTTVDLCKALINTENSFLLPEYAIKGLKADTLNRHIQSRVALLGYLGNYYWQVGNLSEAAEQFTKMRLIGETSSDPSVSANSYIGLGTVYYLMNENEKALEYYQQGLALSGADTLLKVRFYNNIANAYFQLDVMDSVLPYYNRSIIYHKAHQNFRSLSIAYSNLALAYKKKGEGRGAMSNITLAMEMALKSDDPFQIAAVYQNMGYLSRERHPDLAIQSYNEALALARKSQSFDQIRSNLENLAELSETAGKYRNAVAYLNEIKNLDDSLDLIQRKSRIVQMESDHLAAVRNSIKLENERIHELKMVQDENRQKILLMIFCVVLVLLLILFFTGYYNYRLKMKVTRTKERFFSMIAHDIRNPFSGILGLSGLLNEEAENSNDPVHRKQVRSLHQSLNHVYDLLENLLQWSQAETGKIAFKPHVQPLPPFINEVICLHQATGRQKGISLVNQVQSGLKARFDSNMLQTVIRNLISNAIKFSEENSTIFISAEMHGKEVLVKVKDQGIGMGIETLNKIFSSDDGLSTPGTRNETGTGLGLMLCRSFITSHGGRIWAESKPGEGTTVFFTLPD